MFKGSIPALVTPFSGKAVDKKAFAALIEWQIAEGSHAIAPVGTTGESPTLSHEEHEAVIELAVEVAAGRVPVIAGAGSNHTAETLRFAAHAEKVGADGLLVVTPYYNKPTQDGLRAHYETLSANTSLPIVIYNIPGRSVVDMQPELMGALAQHKNIVAVKDATGDLARVAHQRLHCGEDFIQLSGEDATAVGFNAMGGVGAISVTANVAPALCAQMQEATLKGDYETALALQDRLMPLHIALFLEPGLVGAKYALSVLGKCAPDVRLPLTPLSNASKKAIEDAMRHAGLVN